jgi:APA family basic amino acid/polyamine antiporter
VIATLTNILSVSFAGRAQLLLTWLPISFLFGLSLYSLLTPDLVAAAKIPLNTAPPPMTMEKATFSSAFASVFFTYTGWNVLTYMGGDVRNPRESLPRGILWGLGITLVLYMLLNLSFLQALTLENLPAERSPGTFIARALLGDTGATVFAILMVFLILGGLNVTIMAGSRVGLAMGRQGLINSRFARESEDRGTPVFVLLAQAVWCSLLVFTNSFSFLVMATGSVMLLLSMFTVGSIFIFRRRGLTAPYQTPGYPWVPLFYVLVGGGILLLGIADGSTSLISGVLVFTAIAARIHLRGRRAARLAMAE